MQKDLKQMAENAQVEADRLREALQRLYDLSNSDREDFMKCEDIANITGAALKVTN